MRIELESTKAAEESLKLIDLLLLRLFGCTKMNGEESDRAMEKKKGRSSGAQGAHLHEQESSGAHKDGDRS